MRGDGGLVKREDRIDRDGRKRKDLRSGSMRRDYLTDGRFLVGGEGE